MRMVKWAPVTLNTCQPNANDTEPFQIDMLENFDSSLGQTLSRRKNFRAMGAEHDKSI